MDKRATKQLKAQLEQQVRNANIRLSMDDLPYAVKMTWKGYLMGIQRTAKEFKIELEGVTNHDLYNDFLNYDHKA